MAEVTYYFPNFYSGMWADNPYAVDGILTTYAYTASDGYAILMHLLTCPGNDLGTIIKVEVRAYGYGDGNDRIDITPHFPYPTGGDEHQLTMPSSPGWSDYADITNDTNAPSPWTWAFLKDTLEAHLEFDKVGKGGTMYCAKVEIRVTFTWVPPVSDIDVGADPIVRASLGASGWTRVDKNNPANASGILHSVQIHVRTAISGLIVGTFYTTNGNTLKCRDSEAIGDVGIDFNILAGLSIDVQEGDYIGCYFTGGDIERDTTGEAGTWSILGEYIDPNDEATYDVYEGDAISLFGYGDITGPPTYYHGLKVQGEGELALCDVGTHPLRVRKGSTTYGLELVDTSDPNASTIRIKTGAGIKAIRKYT